MIAELLEGENEVQVIGPVQKPAVIDVTYSGFKKKRKVQLLFF